MSVVGVDFGNQNGVIAAAGRGGVDVILNGNSNRQNPVMVVFDKSRSFGEHAQPKAMGMFRHCIKSMKRLVGLSFNDARAQKEMKLLPFECVPVNHPSGHDSTVGVEVTVDDQPTVIGIEHVAGMMVKHLGQIAAKKASDSSSDPAATVESLFPADWVVAIPGYYTDAQRRAFLVGCEVAGIPKIQRLMHETTATALAYGIFKDIRKEFANQTKPTNVMFIDMGASSYQVSIVSFEPGKLIVKSSQYDADLGGRDFDAIIAEWIANEFESKFKGKLSGPVRSRKKVWLKLLVAAEKAKKTLSPAGVKETRINVECLMDDLDFGATLRTKEYEKMCAPLIDRLEPPIQRALKEIGLEAKDLKSVEIVGGATRVSSVKRRLAKILGLNEKATNNGLSTTLNADESVARGAALQSAILSPRFKVLPYEIIEYQPYPIGVSWDEDVHGACNTSLEVEGDVEGGDDVPATNSVVMFNRGSNFPVTRRVTLRRKGEFMVRASYTTDVEGDDKSKMARANFPEEAPKDIAVFKIHAPSDKGEQKIRVNVKEDVHGGLLLSSAQMVEEVYEEEKQATATEAETKDADMTDAKKEGESTPSPIDKGEKKDETPPKENREEASDQPVKKKKIKKTNLPFETERPMSWSKAEVDTAYELEVKMTNTDRIIRETNEKRNELESYLYEMRDKIIGDLASYATEEHRSKFSSILENTENWLYEDGFDATKKVYAEKLAEVRKHGDPISARHAEGVARPNAVSALERTVEKYKTWLNHCAGDERYDHITMEEQQKCHAKCDEISSWMYDMLDKQGSLAMHDDPAVTVAQINAKTNELVGVVSPIMYKPKPKPKPVEDDKAKGTAEGEEKMPTDEKATKKENGSGPEPMDTSAEGSESKETEPMETE